MGHINGTSHSSETIDVLILIDSETILEHCDLEHCDMFVPPLAPVSSDTPVPVAPINDSPVVTPTPSDAPINDLPPIAPPQVSLPPWMDPNKPVHITLPGLIYMIAKEANVVSGQAGDELNISAQTDDTIRWRATTLSLNSDNDVILYKFIAYSSELPVSGELPTPPEPLISNPEPILVTVKAPLPNPDNPTSPGIQEIKSYFYNSVVLNQGTVTYHFCFSIVDRDGTVQGYFWWDPSITITD